MIKAGAGPGNQLHAGAGVASAELVLTGQKG